MSLTNAQQFSLAEKRFNNYGNVIKTINEVGRSAVLDDSQESAFIGMFRTIDNVYDKFMTTWNELAELSMIAGTEFPPGPLASVHHSVTRYYFEAGSSHDQITMRRASRDNAGTNSSANQTTSQSTQSHRCHLPKINLPQFDGKYPEWPYFRDTFSSLVHNEETISQIDKFHFLLASLSGVALGTIKHISVEADNYNQAWEALFKKFNNRRKIAKCYLTQLLNFKPLQGKPNAVSLQNFLSTVGESITSFRRLNIPHAEEFILFELAIKCLDPVTREAFEYENVDTEFPMFSSLKNFIEDRVQALSISTDEIPPEPKYPLPSVPTPNKFQPKVVKQPGQRTTLFVRTAPTNQIVKPRDSKSTERSNRDKRNRLPSCFICQHRHVISDCPDYIKANPHQRLRLLRNWPGCRNCLFPGHITKDCKSTWNCRECNQRHHTTLHLGVPNPGTVRDDKRGSSDHRIHPSSTTPSTAGPSDVNRSSPSTSNAVAQPQHVMAGVATENTSDVLLGTALARIKDSEGAYQTVRMVIDCGSQHSFISEECVRKLRLTPSTFHKSILGVGNAKLGRISGKVACTLAPLHDIAPTINADAIVIPAITQALPQRKVQHNFVATYAPYQLADPLFWHPGPVDLLLGADVYAYIITGLPIISSDEEPQIMNTIFGHVVIGKVPAMESTTQSQSFFVTEGEQDLGELMSKFWAIEEVQEKSRVSPLDAKCEEHFIATHSRLPNGRFIVSLPFVEDKVDFPPTKHLALKRLYNLESKIGKNSELGESYHSFLKEYEELGHMTKTQVPAKYIIPHHAVTKESDCNKLRVVFDASARVGGSALNDHLLVGPKLQKDIGTILLSFRRHCVAFTCDIVKMYRQILVSEHDRVYQHIVWRYDQAQPVEEYELNTITYGLTSSPYLALRVIKQLVDEEGTKYPYAAKSLSNDIYIDDVVTGSTTIEEAFELRTQLIDLLAKGGFQLSKWASNVPALLSSLEGENRLEPITLAPKDDNSIKVLGLQWDTENDTFTYRVRLPQHEVTTKRNILSAIARLYDPLGYLSPTTFHAKVILQNTWKAGISWDEEVPANIKDIWTNFVQELPQVENIKLPRYLLAGSYQHRILGFCDASQKGYCAAIYLHRNNGMSSKLFLLKAKTKLAPLKTLSIPRLELCAALLLARLCNSTLTFQQQVSCQQVCLFTDSTIVLSWLKLSPHLLKTFVAHRITEILDTTNVTWWHHIESSENPADCGSRGLSPSQLVNHTLWWNGPTGVQNDIASWPISTFDIPSDLPEVKSTSVSLVSTHINSDIIDWTSRFSSYESLIRSMAYILRFISNSQVVPGQRSVGPVTSLEFNNANLKLISRLQHFYYPEGFDDSESQHSNLMKSLNVFRDPSGVLRVGGRIQCANLPQQQRHPILLPRRSHYTTLLVDHYHKINCHSGPNALLAYIQQKYWIPAARNLIKERKRKCKVCYTASAEPQPVYMSNLPAERFAEVRPFITTGVDFAGPFICKESSRRKAPLTKGYLCLFICMSTRAVHLEYVPSLSTEAFLDALDRFISRRGIPSVMMSDCGTNFVGASKYLKEVQEWQRAQTVQNKIIEVVTPKGIRWKFNPPHSPHFGGMWEAGVKATKTLLHKSFGNQPFIERELSTIFAKIEAILNSRPLTPLSTDPSDLQPLTPGHFLIGQPINLLPEVDLTEFPEGGLRRWHFLRQQVQLFWDRWRNEYLQTLQTRKKWRNSGRNIQVGEMVLLRDPHTMPLKWPLARVVAIHPGKDNVVRVVTVKTATGTYQRPIMKLVSLEHIVNPAESNV